MTVAPRPWHLIATAIGLTVVFAATYVFFVHGYMGQLIDERARDGAALGSFGAPAAALLDAVPLLSVALVVLAVAIGLIRRQGAATLVALAVVAAANLTTQLLKNELLTRPDNGATGTWHNSFPSGHTTVIASAVFALFLVSAPRVRPAVATIGAVATAIVGVLLLGSQWHRPSDVVGGILVVSIWGCLGGAVIVGLRPRLRTVPPQGVSHLVGVWIIGAVAVLVAFGAAYATAGAPGGYARLATLAGVLAIGAAAIGTASVTTALMRRVA